MSKRKPNQRNQFVQLMMFFFYEQTKFRNIELASLNLGCKSEVNYLFLLTELIINVVN